MDIFHIVNRGVEKRDIVTNDGDRLRFVQNMFILNDTRPAPNNRLSRNKREREQKREPLVHIHAWCLMNNHYHILLSAAHDKPENISKFMQKFNAGYAKYFNEKHNRSGYLWQGRYKKILIERDTHFLYIPYYIHCNPLDYTLKEWRDGKVRNIKLALQSLREYRWSSHLDYLGVKNFSSVITKDLLGQGNVDDMLGTVKQYENSIAKLIQDPLTARHSDRIE